MRTSKNIAIVVGGDHYNTLWIIRSLGLAGYLPIAIIVTEDGRKSFVSHSKYLLKYYIIHDEKQLINLLLNDIKIENRTIILSSSDIAADILDRHFNELTKRYILPNCSNMQGNISMWMDKKRMCEKASQMGFLVPSSTEIDLTKNSILSENNNICYPCIVKPLKSSEGTKHEFKICYSSSELYTTLVNLKKTSCSSVIVQEYIKPDYEISILGMRSRKADLNLVPGVLIKAKTCKSIWNLGMPAYAYIDKVFNKLVDKKIVDNYLNDLDYEGLYSIEYFVKNNRAYFLEINLRVDGDLFVYTTAGVNMPAIWAAINYSENRTDLSYQITRNRTYGMTEISYLKYLDWRHPLKNIKEWLNTDCYSIFSWKDISPFLFKLLNKLI